MNRSSSPNSCPSEKLASQGWAGGASDKERGMFIGIDVSKAFLDVFVRPSGEQMRFDNDEAGIAKLVAQLKGSSPTLVVLEPTGGPEAPTGAPPAVGGIPGAGVNPRQVRDFGASPGKP